jgi:hypothetical protein
MSALGQPAELRPILTCQRFFLRSGPALDLPLAPKRIVPCIKQFSVDQCHRPSRRCVATECAVIVLRDSEIEIVGVADVVRTIGASQQVCPIRHCARPSTSSGRARGSTAHSEPVVFPRAHYERTTTIAHPEPVVFRRAHNERTTATLILSLSKDERESRRPFHRMRSAQRFRAVGYIGLKRSDIDQPATLSARSVRIRPVP